MNSKLSRLVGFTRGRYFSFIHRAHIAIYPAAVSAQRYVYQLRESERERNTEVSSTTSIFATHLFGVSPHVVCSTLVPGRSLASSCHDYDARYVLPKLIAREVPKEWIDNPFNPKILSSTSNGRYIFFLNYPSHYCSTSRWISLNLSFSSSVPRITFRLPCYFHCIWQHW